MTSFSSPVRLKFTRNHKTRKREVVSKNDHLSSDKTVVWEIFVQSIDENERKTDIKLRIDIEAMLQWNAPSESLVLVN